MKVAVYRSVKNNSKAALLNENETGVEVLLLDTNEVKTLSPSTFKRWWKVTEEQHEVVEPEAAEPEEVVVAEELPKEEKPKSEKPKTEKPKADKPKDAANKPGRTKVAGDHPLRHVIEDYATSKGHTIFEGKVEGFRSVKVDGHMYMAFNFNTKGVTLQMRSAAIEKLTDFRKLNHMFDARIALMDDSATTVKLLKKLMDASLDYHLNKRAEKKPAKSKDKTEPTA